MDILPGISNRDAALLKKLKTMREKRGKAYHPRASHLDSEGEALFTNRLFLEKSPYLLQHAHNPVNWHPWSEEAFKMARKEKKPILLSIGYSTCHWCHVMEEESFEDLDIAKFLNENYIAVKVDREERPDIDSIYMNAVQMISGHGGWPMTVWLTPDKQIFYGGTYYPPRTGDRGTSLGFLPLLKELKKMYEDKQESIKKAGRDIQDILQKHFSLSSNPDEIIPDKQIFSSLYSQAKNRWDPVYGGVRGAPKFPSSFPIRILLRTYLYRSCLSFHVQPVIPAKAGIQANPEFSNRISIKTKDKEILQMISSSLDGMLKGGMQDQVGGGFHRYSTDEKWLVPHFEKMLYDQALLAITYLEAYQFLKRPHLYSQPSGEFLSAGSAIKQTELSEGTSAIEQTELSKGVSATKQGELSKQGFATKQTELSSTTEIKQSDKETYKETAINILDYIIRDMQSEEGGFYSATDADSLITHPFEGGKAGEKEEGFYFTWTPEEIDQALNKPQAELIKKYYAVTSKGNFEGRNILHISKSLSETAKELNLNLSQAKTILSEACQILYQTREQRPLPFRDEKILSGWNGLMISAFVYGCFILDEEKYLLQAEKSARFVLNKMYKGGRLYRCWKEGEAYIPAYLEDYSFFSSALLDLFEWTGNMEWLNKALELDQILEKDFEDKEGGGFFMTGQSYEDLLIREKPFYDGAEPSGNSIAIRNLLRLGALTGNKNYRLRAEKAFKAFAGLLKETPFSFSEALLALDDYHSPINEIVLVFPDKADFKSDPFFKEIKNRFLPHKVLTLLSQSQVEERQNILKPIIGKKALNGKTTAYICEEGACHLPTADLKEFKRQLNDVQTLPYK